MNKKYEIEIPGVPEGWKPVAVKPPRKDIDHILTREGVVLFRYDGYEPRLIVEKIKPRRIVFEDTGEVRRPQIGEYVRYTDGSMYLCQNTRMWDNTAEIWREVEEE